MFDKSQQLMDDVKDDIKVLIENLNSRGTWTEQAERDRQALIKHLKAAGYIEFEGGPYRYNHFTVGESCLYDVPLNRRRHLAVFRGKRIRVVCLRSGKFKRLFMAGIV